VAEKDEVKPEDKKVENDTDELEGPEDILEEELLLEPEGKPEPDAKNKVHPLTPGGRRFEQVYAESKQAKRDLVKERELRIAAEAKLDVLTNKTVEKDEINADKEYSWAELEEFIKEGRITRADAEAHREAVITKRVAKTVKGEFKQESTTAHHVQALTGSIQSYFEAVPAILVEGSEDRERIDEEFRFLASVQGVDPDKLDDKTRKALQLTALRTVYGPIDNLTKRTLTTKQPDTQQERPGGVRPSLKANPDQALLDGLTKTQVIHYNKMMRAGRYPGGWKDVVAELKYEAPKRVRR